jgi:O-Antigen ligase
VRHLVRQPLYWRVIPSVIRRASLQQYATVLSILFVAAFYTNFDLYNYVTGLIYPVAPTYVILGLGILSLPIVWLRVREGKVRFDDKLLAFVLISASISLASLIIHFDDENLNFSRVQLSSLLFLLLCYFIFRGDNARLAARRTMLVCLVLAILISLFEVIYPAVFSNVLGRSAGLYINPNINAFALITGAILTLGLLPSRVRVIFLITVGAAVLSSLSKSGIIIWVVVASVLWLQGVVRVVRRRFDIFASILTVLVFVLFFGYAYTNVPYFHHMANKQAGFATKFTEILALHMADADLSGAAVEEVDRALEAQGADASRISLVYNSLFLYKQSPIWGIGMAEAWASQPHNSYLLYGVAYGLLGWVIVPALALVVAMSGDRRIALPMALALLLMSVFFHNLLVDRTVLSPLALAAALKPGAPPQHDPGSSTLSPVFYRRRGGDDASNN